MSTIDKAVIDDGSKIRNAKGEWSPRVLGKGPIFSRPVRPKALLRFLFGFPGYLWPERLFYVGLAVLTWAFLQPGTGIHAVDGDLTALATLQPGWMLLMYARNIALLLLIAGGWHLRLYYKRAQGTRFKYTSRWPATNSKAFLFGDQVKDNMFWSIASGATVWTLYEALMLWAYANGWLPWVELRTNPVWFVALFLLTSLWADVHFYFVHRLTHWKPLYRSAHYLHHRNVNVGPWSGLAMHPIEHLLYFTRWLIFLVVPSHPIHMLAVMQPTAIGPSKGHSGFDEIVVHTSTDTRMSIDSYYHWLHHRYFECNYGASSNLVPLDRWLKTFHDGTAEGLAQMKKRRRMPREAKGLV
jgi:sterol desaturase/sphingolipid hydroxylase (fatty acid hydroxylase superfamily)